MAKPDKKFKDSHDPAFAVLAQEIARAIARNKNGMTQKQRFNELIEAEKAFHQNLLNNSKLSTEIYKRFIQEIRIKNNNILSARPYFRESADNFSLNITPALRNPKEKDLQEKQEGQETTPFKRKSRKEPQIGNPEALKPFAINFHFVKFAKDNWKGLWTPKLEALFLKVERARTILIENNMPLAVNRAKIFYKKTPKGHLTFLDMIEISGMGLAAGIDKYVGEFKPNFIGVCIGRIVGNLIDAYSETVLHFYPGDRRILYRANSIRGRQGITDIPELCKAVNDSFAADLKEGKTAPPIITEADFALLMAAASLVSSDSNVGEEGFSIYHYTADNKESVETILSNKQEIATMVNLARNLPILNRKVLRLKGIEI